MKITEFEGHKFYIVQNTIQAIFPPGEGNVWNKMVPDREIKSALLLGMGAGTLAKLLLDKFSQVKITGVDQDPEMINIAKENLKDYKITYELTNVFNYVNLTEQKFDYIGVDLYDGYMFPIRCLQEEFTHRLTELLTEKGEIVFNLPNLEELIKKNITLSTSRKYSQVNLILRAKNGMLEEVEK